MQTNFAKRAILSLSIVFIIAFLIYKLLFCNVLQPTKITSIQQQLAAFELSTNGKVGVYALNTADNTQIQYRASERFAMCSTHKIIVVAAILKQSMSNPELLQKKINYNKHDILEHSPITQRHLADGMTISELCEAAITQSDNTADNLLIKQLGGIKAVNSFAKFIGDNTFRLDRLEPKLNTAIPGDIRDTSTPAAMAKSLRILTLGNTLGASQRDLLIQWLKANMTGDARIRAGIPNGWIVGDKTGSGYYGTTNDIAIIWPPKCQPIILTIYFTQHKKFAEPKDSVLTEVTRLVIADFAQSDGCLSTEYYPQ